ncbi:MAG TPA: hypothetical protein VHZ03_33890 [Trebonia sp.]|nr:hypothetical protein [Trebonia sp.]
MDWVQDMVARWVRILSAAGDGRTPLDEAVRQISAVGGTAGKKGGFSRLKRNAAPPDDADAVTVLSRQLVAGVLVSDLVIDQLCAVTGQAREQLLAQLSASLPGQLRDQQLRALRAELSGSCEQLRDSGRASYAGLGRRIEQLLKLAEEQASSLIEAARAEAAEITSSGGEQGGTLTGDAQKTDPA